MWELKQRLSPLVKPALTEELLSLYASASGDPNPIHLDPQFAREAGFPSVIAHGMLSMAFIADGLCANFSENKYKVEKLSTRFKKVTFPGDVLTVQGEIKKIQPDGRLLISLWTENQKGEITSTGEAEVYSI